MLGRLSNQARERWAQINKKILLLELGIITSVLGVVIIALFTLWAVNLKLPDFSSFEDRIVAQSTKIYDRTGEILLNSVQTDIRRTVVPKEDISLHVKNATVAIEDAEFYEHRGVKPTAIVRAFFVNLQAGRTVQGGSTITQQVVKNSLLTRDKTIARKLKEAILALRLEGVLDKDSILGLYLNESPYGGDIYGVEEAAQKFFGTTATDLTLAQSAYLAALPKAPTYFSPYGSNVHELEARKNLVLARMVELDFISEEEAEEARAETVTFLPESEHNIKAPHFVFFVRDYLERTYGKEAVERGGLKVTTTLDWDKQAVAEEIVTSFAETNEENFNAKNAGIIMIDPKTGQLLTMVGSRDYFEVENNGNFNVTTALRQPGSAFKPFAYAMALIKGYTPETVLFDVKTEFQVGCSPEADDTKEDESLEANCYQPRNYDGGFRGPMTMRDALAQSINVPAIKALYLAGMRDTLDLARSMGITSLSDPNRYGLTLVIGGGEVSLLEMTNAYATFANDGIYNPVASILKVEDINGEVLEEYTPQPKQVIDKNVARTISDMLSDNEARAPIFGYNSALAFSDRDVAVKTGTTNDFRDMWMIGAAPNIALGAWAGNNDNTSMENRIAGSIIGPMWRGIFNAISPDLAREPFGHPDKDTSELKPVMRGVWQGNDSYFIDTISGKLATEHTPLETREERVDTDVHNILHWVSRRDPRGSAPLRPELDSQYELWEAPVKLWAEANGFAGSSSTRPTEYDDVHKPEYKPQIAIISPAPGTSVVASSPLSLQVSTTATRFPVAEVSYFINDSFVGRSTRAPFTLVVSPSSLSLSPGNHQLRAVVYDDKRNSNTAVLSFPVR